MKVIGIAAPEPVNLDRFPEMLSPEDVAQLMGTDVCAVRYQMRKGNIPSMRIGRRIYVPKGVFVEFVREAMND